MRPIIKTILDLFFPRCCIACEEILVASEDTLCTHCLGTLPQTQKDLLHTPQIEERFWGEVPLHYVSSLFQFTKKGPMQHLLHKIKYCNKPKAMKQLSIYYGSLWHYADKDLPIDYIVPVPLHLRRLQERGYNQSLLLAKGLAKSLKVPCRAHWLQRKVYTETQTDKRLEDRRDNVRGAFQATPKADFKGRHILLVDDLVTIGSTLKACAEVILRQEAQTISVATLSVAV